MTATNPIVGNGFIAKKILKIKKKLIKSKVVLYAAGVSDSKIIDKKELITEFSRIRSYLKKFDNKKKFIYISSFIILDPSRNKSLYTKNKIKNKRPQGATDKGGHYTGTSSKRMTKRVYVSGL